MTESANIRTVLNNVKGEIKSLRPINNYILLEQESGSQQFGAIIVPDVASNGIDVRFGKVLAVSKNAKAATRNGPIKVGDRILSVRVVNKTIDSNEIRTGDGAKVTLLEDLHALAVIADEILPINDLCLVKTPDHLQKKGLIYETGLDSLDITTSKVLATGPDVKQIEPGEFAIHVRSNGVTIDSFELRRNFGGSLKLIREKSLTCAGETAEVTGFDHGAYAPTVAKLRI